MPTRNRQKERIAMDLIVQDHNQELWDIGYHMWIQYEDPVYLHWKEDNAKTRDQHIMHKNIMRYPCV